MKKEILQKVRFHNEKMIDLNRFNKYLGTDFKVLKGCINGLKYVVIAVDNSLVYYDKDQQNFTRIYNKK